MTDNNALIPQDAMEMARRLAAAADVRPSQSGLASAIIMEIGKRGGWRNTREEGGEERPSVRVIPLVLRETRAYWARKGTGSPPDCRSINGVKPEIGKDLTPQAEDCASCPWNKFGTAHEGAGKRCKTRGVLFGLEVNKEGKVCGNVVLRFSMGNRQVADAILVADRKAAAINLPRFLTIWDVVVKVGKGRSEEFLYMSPEFVGPADPAKASAIIESVRELVDGQADRFLSAHDAAEVAS